MSETTRHGLLAPRPIFLAATASAHCQSLAALVFIKRPGTSFNGIDMLDAPDAEAAKKQRHELRNSTHSIQAACNILRRRGADEALLDLIEQHVTVIERALIHGA